MEAVDEASFTALDLAGLLGHKELAQILLDRGAKLRLPGAVGLGRTSEVKKLLRDDPDSLKPGHRWGNLIVRASESSPGAVVESLIRAGADVNVRDDPKTSVDATSGYTPLHAAGFRGNKSAAAALLHHGANVTTREEKYHGTPAGWADYAGHREVRDLILQGPVDIMDAIQYGMTERVRAILAEDPRALDRAFSEYGLYPHDAEGWYTPLAYAALRGRTEIARVLLERGANAAIRSPAGRTLIEMAREKEHRGITELLAAQESPGQLGT